MSGIFIVGAKRTPFGAFGGSLKHLTATELGVLATRAALIDAKVDPSWVNAVYFGNVIPSSNDAAYLSRHVGLKCGVPVNTPSLTLNRLCGSGFESVIQAARTIRTGEASIVIAGGTENMSMAPLQADGNAVRWGTALGAGLQLTDSLWSGLTDAHAGTPMGMTAENLAAQYGLSREECDTYAIRSQTLWGQAQQAGLFAAEMAPVEIKHKKKGILTMDTDEHPRPETTLEKIGQLPTVFKKDGSGVVTAANASGIADGAGSIIVASEAACVQYNLQPLARITSYGIVGCDPTIMGIGPVEAIRAALQKVALNLHTDVDRIEINEAFAPQVLACAKELELDMSKTNIHGGAISLGHPLGASGSRITAHLAHAFHQSGNTNKIHVGAACIGGGQGIALVLERP